MDQFLRAYKIFFTNTCKKLYECLLDVLVQKYTLSTGQYVNSGNSSTIPDKKAIFKHLKSINDQTNALVVLVLIFSQLFNGLQLITTQIKEATKDW